MKTSISFLFHAFILLFPLVSSAQEQEHDVYEKLKELEIVLVEPGSPRLISFAVSTGNLIFLSGHGPMRPGIGFMTGKLGEGGDLTFEEGQEAARLTGISLLASLEQEIGDLNKVKRIVKVTGMINADPSYTRHSQIMNAFSELMIELFGDKGRHARSAVGMGSLPGNIPVEIEMIVEVYE